MPSRPSSPSNSRLRGWVGAALLATVLPLGCTGGPESVKNPPEVLSRSGLSRERYFDALEAAQIRGVDDPTKAALRRMIAADGYAIDVREKAFQLLYATDPKEVTAALENALPRMGDIAWRERVCALIAEKKMASLVPALIRSWANPAPGLQEKGMRPERAAIAAIVGESQVTATLLKTMRDSSPITQANLRARCWELVMKSGQSVQLRELLADPAATRGDAMLTDLARVANDLGVLPVTREEILWARELCKPERAAFFADAKKALAAMPKERRESLEVRALPIAVAALHRRPALLTAPEPELYEEIASRIKDRKKASPDFTGFGAGFTELLYEQRERAKWSDLAAMVTALDILSEEAMLRHLFEQADRDREDRTTEYGGVVTIDASGRGELIEFPPRAKMGDLRFESPQPLFDALYTGLFHFHNHTQRYDNSDYAGPHTGDFAFADSTHCNALVFTYLSADAIDVDFYRYDRFVVDLGVVKRPQG